MEVYLYSFCTTLFSLIYGHSRWFIPKINSCAAFCVILPLGSMNFSSEQFNTLHPLKVIVVLCKYIVTLMNFVFKKKKKSKFFPSKFH